MVTYYWAVWEEFTGFSGNIERGRPERYEDEL